MDAFLWMACFTVAILSSVVSAENNIKFINHCPYDVYSWAVGPAKSGWTGHDHEAFTIPANTVTYRGMANCELTHGGISVKLRDLPRYEVAPAGIIQVEYNLIPSKNHLWYDLSVIDCNHNVGPEHPSFCPLIDGGMKVYAENAEEGRCPPAWCDADGQCHNTYKEHGYWQGEPSFRCDAGKDVVVEFCTARAGPRTFNGYNEPGHHEPLPDKKPGNPTTNGICGAMTPDGATCFGYAHGNCCSQYGWCGFTDGHCGTGCQSGFGNCTSDADAMAPSYQPPAHSPSYSPPSKPSTLRSIYSRPTPVYSKPKSVHSKPALSYYQPIPEQSSSAPIYYTPPTSHHPTISSYSPAAPVYYPPPSGDHQSSTTHTPGYSHIEHLWPSYDKPSSTYSPTYYTPPIHSKSTPVYNEHSSSYTAPSHSKSTAVYSKLTKGTYTPTYKPPPHTKSLPAYSKPSKSIYTPTYHVPTLSKSTLVYTKPSSSYDPPAHTRSEYIPTLSHSSPSSHVPLSYTSSQSPPYTPTPYRTIYATHIITETRPHITKTVTMSVSSEYHAPSPYPDLSYSTSGYDEPSYAETPQQDPHIPSPWYSTPTTSWFYVASTSSSQYYEHPASEYSAPTPTHSEPWYYPPPPRA